VGDAQLVESPRPLVELAAIRASEGHVIQPECVLTEPDVGRLLGVQVQPDERPLADQVDGVMEVLIGNPYQGRCTPPASTTRPEDAWLLSACSIVTVIVENAAGDTPDQSVTSPSPELNVPIGTPVSVPFFSHAS